MLANTQNVSPTTHRVLILLALPVFLAAGRFLGLLGLAVVLHEHLLRHHLAQAQPNHRLLPTPAAEAAAGVHKQVGGARLQRRQEAQTPVEVDVAVTAVARAIQDPLLPLE